MAWIKTPFKKNDLANLELKISIQKWKQNGDRFPEIFKHNELLRDKLRNNEIERNFLKEKLGNITLQMNKLKNLMVKYQEYRSELKKNM